MPASNTRGGNSRSACTSRTALTRATRRPRRAAQTREELKAPGRWPRQPCRRQQRLSHRALAARRRQPQLSPGLQRLEQGAKKLAAGLGKTQAGAGQSGRWLGRRRAELNRLTASLGRMHSGLEDQNAGNGNGSQLSQLHDNSPGLFHSGYFYLASLDGSKSDRQQPGCLPDQSEPRRPRRPDADRPPLPVEQRAGRGAEGPHPARRGGPRRRNPLEVLVGGIAADQLDLNTFSATRHRSCASP